MTKVCDGILFVNGSIKITTWISHKYLGRGSKYCIYRNKNIKDTSTVDFGSQQRIVVISDVLSVVNNVCHHLGLIINCVIFGKVLETNCGPRS